MPTASASARESPNLYPREKECLRLVLALRTSKAIADHLGIKPDTVDGYLKSGMRKLGASDRYAAARMLYAFEQPGFEPPPFGVPQSAGMPSLQEENASALQQSGQPEVQSELREISLAFDAGPAVRSSLRSFVLGSLFRPEGGHNRLSGQRRLALMLKLIVTTVCIFFAMSAALLALAAASRELLRH